MPTAKCVSDICNYIRFTLIYISTQIVELSVELNSAKENSTIYSKEVNMN